MTPALPALYVNNICCSQSVNSAQVSGSYSCLYSIILRMLSGIVLKTLIL